MDEYIKRETAVRAVMAAKWGDGSDGAMAMEIVASAPAADVAPVVHGRWINAYPDIEPNPLFMYGICSNCSFEQGLSDKLNYCPNCGAKMDGGDSDEAD